MLENPSTPFEQALAFGMPGLGHGLEEIFEAWNSADVFWRSAAGAVDEARVVEAGIGITDSLDRERVLPVAPKSWCR